MWHIVFLLGNLIFMLLQSTGAYKAASRLAIATPPPAYVLSRGIGWQVSWLDTVVVHAVTCFHNNVVVDNFIKHLLNAFFILLLIVSLFNFFYLEGMNNFDIPIDLAGDWDFAGWSFWNLHWFYCISVRTYCFISYSCREFLFHLLWDSKWVRKRLAIFRENVGLLGLTRVGSRRVVQISAGFMIFFAMLGW